MIKEQYKQQKSEIEAEIDALKLRLKNLQTRYIIDNSEFSIDDRIKITSPAGMAWSLSKSKIPYPEKVKFAYVKGIRIDWQGDIEYLLWAEKKDGTRSLKTETYSNGRDKIELA